MAVECIDSGIYVSKILSQRRKAKKPLMEKLRRARINDSLNELKSLVLELLNKDASRYSKMEKADILEMTVNYMRAMQRQDKYPMQDATSLAEYRAGFNQCTAEVTRNTISASDGCENLRAKLITHLASCCHGSATGQVASSTMTTAIPAVQTSPLWVPYPSPPPSPIRQGAAIIPSTNLLHASDSHNLRAVVSPVSPPYFAAQNSIHGHSQINVQSPVKTAVWRPW